MVRKIKIGKIEMNFSDRWLYTFIAIGIIILLGVVVYGWSNSAGVGHGLDEIQPCGDGEILKTSGGSWGCVDGSGVIDTYCSVSGNTISCPDGTSLSDTHGSLDCITEKAYFGLSYSTCNAVCEGIDRICVSAVRWTDRTNVYAAVPCEGRVGYRQYDHCRCCLIQ